MLSRQQQSGLFPKILQEPSETQFQQTLDWSYHHFNTNNKRKSFTNEYKGAVW